MRAYGYLRHTEKRLNILGVKRECELTVADGVFVSHICLEPSHRAAVSTSRLLC